MALDATGTPTSPDSIPKYNTAVDPPSGKGFNAAMDALQVALSARVDKPASIASGEVPVWNGASWVRSSATRVGLSSITAGLAGQVLGGTGPAYAYPPGYEYGYTEFTSNVSITATTEATANQIVSAGAITFDGAPVRVEFGAYLIRGPASVSIFVELYDGASSIGVLGQYDMDAGADGVPPRLTRRFTPTAVAHTYSIRAHLASAGTGTVFGGAGGVGLAMPGFIRITKV